MNTKRSTLADFAPKPAPAPDGAKIMQAAPTEASKAARSSLTVYLTPEEVRTLKLICLDHNKRLTDVCAEAIRDWLKKNGHARGKLFEA
ncbi:MAG: hypothetical protein ACK5QX_05795 [bacterium]